MSNYAAIKPTDIANGPGVRVSVFLSGCPHHCLGCFNSEAWDYDYGTPLTLQVVEKVQSLLNHSFIQGLTLLGGEPMAPHNTAASVCLAMTAKELGKTVWIYSGYTFEELQERCLSDSQCAKLLSLGDVLVDGRFRQELADKRLVFKGSANQRIICLPASLKQGKIVLWEEPYAHY